MKGARRYDHLLPVFSILRRVVDHGQGKLIVQIWLLLSGNRWECSDCSSEAEVHDIYAMPATSCGAYYGEKALGCLGDLI